MILTNKGFNKYVQLIESVDYSGTPSIIIIVKCLVPCTHRFCSVLLYSVFWVVKTQELTFSGVTEILTRSFRHTQGCLIVNN